jgi:EpsI family protein
MSSRPGLVRLCGTVVLLLCAFALLQTLSHGEAIVPRQPLRSLPFKLGDWIGIEQPLQSEVIRTVGVTDYTNRTYVRPAAMPVQVYVGYYASQRTGDTIHSPKNCLPGAGWDPIRSGYATIHLSDGRNIVVNEYVIQQDQDKQLVFYWYQGRGRVVASEYAGKFWMIADAISRNRTDGALVRLVTPINGGEDLARERLIGFAQTLFPPLDKLIPN